MKNGVKCLFWPQEARINVTVPLPSAHTPAENVTRARWQHPHYVCYHRLSRSGCPVVVREQLQTLTGLQLGGIKWKLVWLLKTLLWIESSSEPQHRTRPWQKYQGRRGRKWNNSSSQSDAAGRQKDGKEERNWWKGKSTRAGEDGVSAANLTQKTHEGGKQQKEKRELVLSVGSFYPLFHWCHSLKGCKWECLSIKLTADFSREGALCFMWHSLDGVCERVWVDEKDECETD